nr:MAG TPA: hypothetical protein [Caudoviricetes sp.]
MAQYPIRVGNRYSKQSREVCAPKLLAAAFFIVKQ